MSTALEVDHVFVCVRRGAPELEALIGSGFTEGPPNRHPGQGTACRRIFFENAYLEMAWLENEAEAAAPAVERTGLVWRMKCADGVSRLGVALRPVGSGTSEPRVDTWRYEPPYLPEGVSIPVAANSRVLQEPLLFFMPRDLAWAPSETPHPNGARAVTGITVTLPALESRSAELRWLGDSRCLEVVSGPSEMLEIEMDGGRCGESVDLTPTTPLRLRW